jgi:hypothetical protein
MNARIVSGAVMIGILIAGGTMRGASSDDHLEPFVKFTEYEKLIQKWLFVTPGDVARFFQEPEFDNRPETAISIYRDLQKPNGLAGGYWITSTQPDVSLQKCLHGFDNKHLMNPATIKIHRHDAPLPKSTGVLIHRLWLTMLQQAKPVANPERYIRLDSSTEVFIVTNPNGKVLTAAGPTAEVPPNAKTLELVRIAFHLLDFPEVKAPDRPALAHRIEAQAATLFKRASRGR